jgi:hypothetical protein
MWTESLAKSLGYFHLVPMRKKVNNYGHILLELCSNFGVYVTNGRCGKDNGIGHYTCAQCSVDDYFLLSYQLFDTVEDFEVEVFNPLFSDIHNPLVLNCNVLGQSRSANQVKSVDKLGLPLWRTDKEDQFVQNIDRNIVSTLLEWSNENIGVEYIPQSDLDEVLSKFSNLFANTCTKTFVTTVVYAKKIHNMNTNHGECRRKQVFNMVRNQYKRVKN